jgi:hypothetical protein
MSLSWKGTIVVLTKKLTEDPRLEDCFPLGSDVLTLLFGRMIRRANSVTETEAACRLRCRNPFVPLMPSAGTNSPCTSKPSPSFGKSKTDVMLADPTPKLVLETVAMKVDLPARSQEEQYLGSQLLGSERKKRSDIGYASNQLPHDSFPADFPKPESSVDFQ